MKMNWLTNLYIKQHIIFHCWSIFALQNQKNKKNLVMKQDPAIVKYNMYSNILKIFVVSVMFYNKQYDPAVFFLIAFSNSD